VLLVLVGLLAGPRVLGGQTVSTGVVRSDQTVIVRSEVAGIVEEILAAEGQAVTEGDLLVRVRDERQEIGVQLAQARAVRAEAALRASDVTLGNARSALARVERAGNALPRRDGEDLADEVRRLEAMREAQAAEHQQAVVEVELMRRELEETRLSAPFDGTVTTIAIERGDTLAPLDTPVLVLVNLAELYVELVLPVEQISRIAEGRRLNVHVEEAALGGAGSVTGVVAYVNPTVDPSSRTFSVKIRISDASGRIRPGMRAVVEVP
jgi:HlyD family secretion protein